MAVITLGDLKTLWDNVSAWVMGTSTSRPKIQVVNAAGTELVTPLTALINGNATMIEVNITCSGSAQQLHADTASRVITVQAHPGNSGYVYVGKSTVSATAHMYVLTPGSSYTITATNLNKVYVLGTSGDKVIVGGEV